MKLSSDNSRKMPAKAKPATRQSKKSKLGSLAKPARAVRVKELKLIRSEDNPIIEPNPRNSWESKATFNPAALYDEGKVHLLYRAIGDRDISVLGYAISSDGFHIDEKSDTPAYSLESWFTKRGRPNFLPSPSGGGFGGAEDPRMTKLDDRIYMTYTHFDGSGALRVALTAIDARDFHDKNWKWEKPVLISPPGEMNKNWVIFPEKIRGKYAILHSISPEILIDYLDDLEFDGETYIKSRHDNQKPRKNCWDSRVRGAGPPPIKTQYGWLLLYHAIDDKDPGRYKLGAMILDLKTPEKILYRSAVPILEPDVTYENDGYKAGVVYACGAVVDQGNLFVYYGGADSVVCVANTDLDSFLGSLIKTGSARLTRKSKLTTHD